MKVTLVLYIFVVTNLSCTCILSHAFLACARATPLYLSQKQWRPGAGLSFATNMLLQCSLIICITCPGLCTPVHGSGNKNILDERRVEQFSTSVYFLSAVYRNLGLPADWLLLRRDSTGLVSASVRPSVSSARIYILQ